MCKKYRIFVSHSRGDIAIARRVYAALKSLGHFVSLDKSIRAGADFMQTIQRQIKRAHFFVPILTPAAWASEWVQQEIGYAVACAIPIVPVVVGEFAMKGMIDRIQAITVKQNVTERTLCTRFRKVLSQVTIDEPQATYDAVFRCDVDENRRAMEIADTAEEIARNCQGAQEAAVMQRSPLTSFCLPEQEADPHWRGVPVDEHGWFYPRERIAMENLARLHGCDVIIDPCFSPPPGSPKRYLSSIQRAKLRTLADFLCQNQRHALTRVVVQRFVQAESETIIGDHWMGHSAAVMRIGTRRETISTWHEPTVLRYKTKFRSDFDHLLRQQGAARGGSFGTASAEYAVRCIECAIEKLCSGKYMAKRESRCGSCRFAVSEAGESGT
jgi:hypothetical protein